MCFFSVQSESFARKADVDVMKETLLNDQNKRLKEFEDQLNELNARVTSLESKVKIVYSLQICFCLYTTIPNCVKYLD